MTIIGNVSDSGRRRQTDLAVIRRGFRDHITAASYIYIYIYIYIYVSLYLYVPDEGSLLPKYRDCTTYNDFELYLMCCGVMLQ